MSRNINVHVFNLNKQITKSIYARLEYYGITRAEIPYITVLYQETDVTQEHLSKVLGFNEGTVTRALKRLENKGIVERVPFLKDRRKKMVRLTEEGQEKADQLSNIKDNFEKELFANFTQEEREQLHNLLEKLAINLAGLVGRE